MTVSIGDVAIYVAVIGKHPSGHALPAAAAAHDRAGGSPAHGLHQRPETPRMVHVPRVAAHGRADSASQPAPGTAATFRLIVPPAEQLPQRVRWRRICTRLNRNRRCRASPRARGELVVCEFDQPVAQRCCDRVRCRWRRARSASPRSSSLTAAIGARCAAIVDGIAVGRSPATRSRSAAVSSTTPPLRQIFDAPIDPRPCVPTNRSTVTADAPGGTTTSTRPPG